MHAWSPRLGARVTSLNSGCAFQFKAIWLCGALAPGQQLHPDKVTTGQKPTKNQERITKAAM
jgi:hypothetical protein